MKKLVKLEMGTWIGLACITMLYSLSLKTFEGYLFNDFLYALGISGIVVLHLYADNIARVQKYSGLIFTKVLYRVNRILFDIYLLLTSWSVYFFKLNDVKEATMLNMERMTRNFMFISILGFTVCYFVKRHYDKVSK